MMKILLTGATGFVGNHIRKEIDIADNQIMFLIANGEEFIFRNSNSIAIKADLKNLTKIKDKIKTFAPEACIHCAWQGIPDYSEDVSKLNLFNSLALVDLLLKETSCKKLIIAGSCFEYGKTLGICKEHETGTPNQFFTWAKQSLYNYSDLMARNNNRTLIWFRMFYVYGANQRIEALIPSLISSFQNNEKPKINKPFNANDFIYMPDAAKAYRLALVKNVPSGIYNIGSGGSTRVIDICRLVEKKILGSSLITDQIEKECDRTQDVNFHADTSKTQKILGFKAERSLDEGISHYITSLGNKK